MLKSTLMQHAVIAGSLMLTPCFVMAEDWVASGNPVTIPFDAIIGGHEAPGIKYIGNQAIVIAGSPLYVCRGGAKEGYNTQVGKFRSDFGGCDFGFGGREVSVPDFQFLVANWEPASFGAIPSNAVVGGYGAPGQGQFFGPPLYFCRANVAGSDLQLGKVNPDLHGCFIPYGGRELNEAQYQVLVSGIPYTTVTASNGVVPPDAIRAGRDDDGTDLYVCSAYFGGGTHPGKLRGSFRGCDISWGGGEHIVASYQVLVPSWSGYPHSNGEDYRFDFPAGSDSGGATLFACRAHFDGGVQPGKTRGDWSTCNFGYGGKETTVSSYDILSTLEPVLR